MSCPEIIWEFGNMTYEEDDIKAELLRTAQLISIAVSSMTNIIIGVIPFFIGFPSGMTSAAISVFGMIEGSSGKFQRVEKQGREAKSRCEYAALSTTTIDSFIRSKNLSHSLSRSIYLSQHIAFQNMNSTRSSCNFLFSLFSSIEIFHLFRRGATIR